MVALGSYSARVDMDSCMRDFFGKTSTKPIAGGSREESQEGGGSKNMTFTNIDCESA